MAGNDTTTTDTTVETPGGSVEEQDINYDAATNVREGRSETGAEVEDAATDTETGEVDADAAGEAGKTLAGRRKTLVADLQKEREENKKLKERLDIYQSWDPIIKNLSTRPDLQQAVIDGKITVEQAEHKQATDQEKDPELREIAEDFGWTKVDGVTPDLDRAARYRARHTKWAKETAGEEVKPLAKDVASRSALAAVDHAVKYAEVEAGKRAEYADPAFVRDEMTKAARTNPEWFASNETANELYHRVVGRAFSLGKTVKGFSRAAADEERHEPDFVVTETAGGRGAGKVKLTAAEREMGARFGLTDKDWKLAEQHQGVRRGYTVLDED